MLLSYQAMGQNLRLKEDKARWIIEDENNNYVPLIEEDEIFVVFKDGLAANYWVYGFDVTNQILRADNRKIKIKDLTFIGRVD